MNPEKSGDRKPTQRHMLKSAALMALAAFSFSGAILRPQQVKQKTVSRQLAADSDQGSCQEDKIVPNVKPQWKSGQTFRYETTKTENTKSAASGEMRGASGEIILKSEPLPIRQTITIGGNTEYSGENGLFIQREGVLENPMASTSEQTSGEGWKDKSKSFVNAKGKIRYCESETTMTIGESTSVSTNSSSGFSASSDLHYFYGYWMLALTPDFSWECLKNSQGDQVFIKLKVTGIENLNGKECFVVERTYRKEPEESQITTYWVDKANRIAVQVKKGNYVIRLVS